MCSSVVNTSHSSNYLKQFRDSSSLELQKLSAVQFMSVWEHYDQDGENILLKVWNILMSNIFFLFHRKRIYWGGRIECIFEGVHSISKSRGKLSGVSFRKLFDELNFLNKVVGATKIKFSFSGDTGGIWWSEGKIHGGVWWQQRW